MTIHQSERLTVVAFLALSAIARHVAVPAARVARLPWTSARSATISSSTTVAPATTLVTTTVTSTSSTFCAVPCDMSYLATFVAFLTTSASATATAGVSTCAATADSTASAGARVWVRAIARDMTSFTATIARLFLLRCVTFAAHMAFLATVVACWRATLWAVAGLMGIIST